MVAIVFSILIIIGWALWIAAPHVPDFIWICYVLAWAVWLVRFGYKVGKW